jgi:hypothetical protein
MRRPTPHGILAVVSGADEQAVPVQTAALEELLVNLDYARDLVEGGRFLERLRVGAFDVADLYRAAWVQAVSALDHWVHRELYDRAVGFALRPSAPRPARFRQIQVPMSLLEDVQDGSSTMRDAFTAELRRQFGWQSYQAPDKIKQALANISDIPLWSNVAKQLSRTEDDAPVNSEAVQAQLRDIVKRRNRIAHEADRDPDRPGARNPISDTEATETIDWIQQMAVAAAKILGPPPVDRTEAATPGTPVRQKWTRQDIRAAVDRMTDNSLAAAARRLLDHADTHQALFRGGVGPDPSAGLYYWLHGHRRSIWSLYLNPDHPAIALSFGSVWQRDQQLARRMLAEVRTDPTLNATLPQGDNVLRQYPSIELTTLARSAQTLNAVVRAIEIATTQPTKPSFS